VYTCFVLFEEDEGWQQDLSVIELKIPIQYNVAHACWASTNAHVHFQDQQVVLVLGLQLPEALCLVLARVLLLKVRDRPTLYRTLPMHI
jgi:hypothetical protein